MNEKNELQAAYNELKKDISDPIECANKTILQLYPDATESTSDAWNALKDKEQIKQFYLDFVAADYANAKGLDINNTREQEHAQTAIKIALHEFFDTIKGNPNEGGKNAFNNFLQELKDHDTKNDFQCDLLPADSSLKPLNFPKSTLSIIAGRPSAGKTTALASMAMYAMRSTSKKVLFITSEETPQQLFIRFIKNEFYTQCTKEGKGNLLAHDYSKTYINDTFKDIIKKHYADGEIFTNPEQSDFSGQAIKAAESVKNYVESGRLQIFNLDKTTSFDELKDILQEQSRHTIIIIDYIQNLPYAPKEKSTADRLEILRSEIYAINQIIKISKLIGIAGAQFNREGASEYAPDTLELNKLGDSGEIERKAHIVIGLGRKYNNDRWQYFYRVLKDREGSTSAAHFEIMNDSEYAYSYMQAKTQEIDGKQKLVIMNLQQTKRSNGKKGIKDNNEDKSKLIQQGKAILTRGGWNDN